MKIEYDPSIDAIYIYLADKIDAGGVAKTYPCDPSEVCAEINLDFDPEGRLIGIEVQDASKKVPASLLIASKKI